jgi:hypothetical protein
MKGVSVGMGGNELLRERGGGEERRKGGIAKCRNR